MHTIHYHVRESDQSTDLFGLLRERFGRYNDAEWQVQIDRGRLTVNGELGTPNTPIEPGAIVGFDPSDHEEPPTDTRWQALYEDEAVWVINKPAPLPCHRNGPYLRSNLMALLRKETGGARMHLMARLDRDTSGAVLVAKDRETCQAIHRSGQTSKTYWCVVHGSPPESFVCDEPMGPEPDHPTRQRCGVGKAAHTRFRRLHSHGGYSLVEAQPETGRTHQIRCHLAHAGWPIRGDRLYNAPVTAHEAEATRQMLHAAHIAFKHPTHGPLSIWAPAPDDFVQECRRLELCLPDVDTGSEPMDSNRDHPMEESKP